MDGPFHGQKPARPPPPSSLPSTAEWPGSTRALPRWRERWRCTCAHEAPPNGGTVRVSHPRPVSWQPLSRPKAISAAGQAAFALHAMAILQVHQAKVLKQVHEGSTDPGLMQELRSATDFALRATKVNSAGPLRKAMSIMVVQERHLWLNLAEMKDVRQGTLSRAPISQAWLFGNTVEGFAQQFSAVQQQTEAIQHILPRRGCTNPPLPPGPGPQSARRRGRPLCVLQSCLRPQAESTPRPARRASRRRAAPPRSQPGPKSSRKSTKAALDAGNPEMLEFALSQEMVRTVPLLPPVEGRKENLLFHFVSVLPLVQGPAVPHFLKERAISLSSGFSGPWVCDSDSVRRPASSLLPTTHFACSQESTVRGRHSSLRTSAQSRLGPREFGEDTSERTAFCTIHPLLPFAAPPQVCRLHRWSHMHIVWRRGSRCSDCLAGSRAQFESATWFSSPGDLPSSTAFSRRRWQSGTPLSCARGDCCPPGKGRNRASPSSRDEAGGFTALTSSYPRKVVAFGQSWICKSWTRLYTSSRLRCWCTGAWSNAFSPRIGLQRSTWRTLTFTFRSFHDTDRFYGLRSKDGHGSTGSSPSGSPCLPVRSRRS